MWQGIIVAAVVGLAALWVGRRLYRTMRGTQEQDAECGCGCQGPCHQPEPFSAPEPPACRSCLQRPEDIDKLKR